MAHTRRGYRVQGLRVKGSGPKVFRVLGLGLAEAAQARCKGLGWLKFREGNS